MPNKFAQEQTKGKWSYQLFLFGASRGSKFWASSMPIRRVSPSTGRPVYGHTHAEAPRIRRPMCLIQKGLLVTHAARQASSTDGASYDVEAGLPPIQWGSSYHVEIRLTSNGSLSDTCRHGKIGAPCGWPPWSCPTSGRPRNFCWEYPFSCPPKRAWVMECTGAQDVL